MAITYTDNIELIDASDLEGFFVGWTSCPPKELHYEVLKGSFKVWLVLEDEKCVGFINAISDGTLTAFIPLLEVLPEYQHKGIGKVLVERMLDDLKIKYSIDLVCDGSIAPFYEKLGFQKCIGMSIRHYENVKGSQ